ncbi:MAG: ADOP family duplicated permease [Gammaproteobacteria bacterium]|nr:ADOP family duplicated permease [Gammaproteobacteria bacterium]
MRMILDLKQASRSLRRTPGFTVLAALCMSIGLGATAAVFTVVKQVLLDPLGYPDADRLVVLRSAVPKSGMGSEWGFASAQYFHLGDNAKSLADIGASQDFRASVATPDGLTGARVTQATAGIHRLIGAQAVLGRVFEEADDDPGARRVAVLSYGYWQDRFGGDPEVVGKTIRFDPGIVGRALTAEELAQIEHRIVGVLAPGTGMFDVDLWIPWILDRAGPHYNQHGMFVMAKLADGVGIDAARTELTGLTAQLVDAYPEVYSRGFIEQFGFRTVVHDAKRYRVGAFADHLWLLQAGAVLLLIVAWGDVANLLLARAETSRRDLAVRTALGAGWRDAARHHAALGLLLTVPAAALGALIAWGAINYLVATAPLPLPRLDEVALDGGVFAFLAAVSAIAAAGLAALPASRVRHFGLDLAEAGRGATHSRERTRVRAGMVVGQVALTLVLMVLAGGLVESFRSLRNVDPGIDAEAVVSVAVTPNASHTDIATWWALVRDTQDRLESLPGVTAVGASSAVPLNWFPGCAAQQFDDPAVYERVGASDFTTCASVLLTTPGWFRTLGIPIIEGRGFEMADLTDPGRGVVVVSRSFADRFWPNENAIGKRISAYGGPWYTIVGVVGDVYGKSVDEPPAIAAYYPLNPVPGSRWPHYGVAMAVRTGLEDPAAILPAVLREFEHVDPTMQVEAMPTLADIVGRSMAPASFASTMFIAVAIGALVLALAGLYGVVSHVAARRTTEIGVRMALGARPDQVRRMVVAGGLKPVVLGVVLGVPIGVIAAGMLRGLLFGVTPVSPAVHVTAAVLLVAAGTLATWIAARRATAIQPLAALRVE